MRSWHASCSSIWHERTPPIHPPDADRAGTTHEEVSNRDEVAEFLSAFETATPRGNVDPSRATGLLPHEQATFHNVPTPQVGILTERPEHYAILVLLARGLTQREVHVETGWSEAWISQIARQPWAKERLFGMMSRQGKDIVHEMLRLEVIPSIQKLVDLRDGGDGIPASVQARAADSLLDRYLGKAVQKVESYDGGKTAQLQDVEKLDAAIAEAEREVQRLQGRREAQPIMGESNREVPPNIILPNLVEDREGPPEPQPLSPV